MSAATSRFFELAFKPLDFEKSGRFAMSAAKTSALDAELWESSSSPSSSLVLRLAAAGRGLCTEDQALRISLPFAAAARFNSDKAAVAGVSSAFGAGAITAATSAVQAFKAAW